MLWVYFVTELGTAGCCHWLFIPQWTDLPRLPWSPVHSGNIFERTLKKVPGTRSSKIKCPSIVFISLIVVTVGNRERLMHKHSLSCLRLLCHSSPPTCSVLLMCHVSCVRTHNFQLHGQHHGKHPQVTCKSPQCPCLCSQHHHPNPLGERVLNITVEDAFRDCCRKNEEEN